MGVVQDGFHGQDPSDAGHDATIPASAPDPRRSAGRKPSLTPRTWGAEVCALPLATMQLDSRYDPHAHEAGLPGRFTGRLPREGKPAEGFVIRDPAPT
jgi:hypothetical protein